MDMPLIFLAACFETGATVECSENELRIRASASNVPSEMAKFQRQLEKALKGVQ